MRIASASSLVSSCRCLKNRIWPHLTAHIESWAEAKEGSAIRSTKISMVYHAAIRAGACSSWRTTEILRLDDIGQPPPLQAIIVQQARTGRAGDWATAYNQNGASGESEVARISAAEGYWLFRQRKKSEECALDLTAMADHEITLFPDMEICSGRFDQLLKSKKAKQESRRNINIEGTGRNT